MRIKSKQNENVVKLMGVRDLSFLTNMVYYMLVFLAVGLALNLIVISTSEGNSNKYETVNSNKYVETLNYTIDKSVLDFLSETYRPRQEFSTCLNYKDYNVSIYIYSVDQKVKWGNETTVIMKGCNKHQIHLHSHPDWGYCLLSSADEDNFINSWRKLNYDSLFCVDNEFKLFKRLEHGESQ